MRFNFLQKSLPADRVLTNIKYLGILSAMYSVVELFVGTFLLAYFFKVSQDNVVVIAAFYLSYAATVFIAAWLTGFWLKTHSKMAMYRWGCVVNLAFFAFVWLVKEQVADYTVFLGFLHGFISSLRYFTRNLVISESVSEQKMIKFQGYLETVCNVLKVVAPVVMGFVLTVDSLNRVMGILSVLVVVDMLLSLKVVESKQAHPVKFDMGAYIKKTFQRKEVRYIYYMEVFRGFTLSGALNVVATLYIVYLFHTNFNLGSLTSFFAFASIATNFLFGRYCKYEYFVHIIAFSSVISVLASLLFVLFPTKEMFILYNLCYVTVARLLLIITNVNMFNIANSLKVKMLFKTEYFAMREMFLSAGRFLGYFILLVIGFYQNFELLRYFLLFLTVCIGIMGYCSIVINRTLFKR